MEITALNLPGNGAGVGGRRGWSRCWRCIGLAACLVSGRNWRWGRRLERWGGEANPVAAAMEDDATAVLDGDVLEVAAGQDADFAAGIGQGVNCGLDRGVLAEAFYAIADGDGAAAAAGVFAIAAAACPWIAAVSGGSGVEVDNREAGVVVVNAAWRSVLELLDAAVGGACGEGPKVAGVEGAGGAEGDGDPVFEDDCGSGGVGWSTDRWNLLARGCRRRRR
jgi:hypothetical protein